MIEFIMQHATYTVHVVHMRNMLALSTEWDQYKWLPWLLDFCDGDSDNGCLSTLGRRRVAAMLNGLVNVGTVDCAHEHALCEQLQTHSGVLYFPAASIHVDHKQVRNISKLCLFACCIQFDCLCLLKYIFVCFLYS